MRFIKIIILSLLVVVTINVTAQTKQNLDKIVAIVGEHVILQSDVNQTMQEYKAQNPEISDSAMCTILETILSQDLLAEQAGRDSITVSEDEVDGNLENRIRYFVNAYGSEEKMTEVTGKTVYQLKDEYRRVLKDQLLAQRMQGQIMSSIKITPAEVRAFFEKIPSDSLPLYPSMVEVGQLVIAPIASKEVEDYARQQLEDTRQQIVSGKMDFATAAGMVSEDGARDNGGDLGFMSREDLVPEFSSAAFKLKNGEISPVIKSRYGFHIILMIQRKGEKAHIAHILIKPKITSADLNVCKAKLDSIKNLIVTKKMSFAEAVGKFSTDDITKNTGGMFSNTSTGSSFIGLDELEPDVALAVGKLKNTEISEPMIYADMRAGDRLCRIVYLKNISEPHKANLKEDYNKIMQVAIAEKQTKYMGTWVNDHISNFFIYINEDYNECANIKKWMQTKNSEN
jgi:peptidyl-prolyl cis-trans isomerase SurA